MKNVLTKTVLALALASTVGGSAVFAKAAKKTKHSPAYTAAVRKCNDDYKAALKTDKSLKGKERKTADAKAKQDRKQCIAAAPK